MATEIELKLRLPPDSVARLRRNRLLKSLSISHPVTRKLYTVYYDTPDFDLRRHDIAFRLRRTGKNWIQSIKGGGDATAGLHQRYEWEIPLRTAQPDFIGISDPFLIEFFKNADIREQLRPVFTTEFKRSTRTLCLPGGSEAEFCLDQGVVSTVDASVPFCEVELELKSGGPLPLFQLALDLLHTVPLRLENVSKAERGYTLASGDKPPPLRAAPVQLFTEMNVSEAFKAIAWNCLNHLHSNEPGMLECRDVEYLHQMRVALRRERSAFSIFSKAFSKSAFSPLAQDLKWLSRQLRPARDWDVFVTGTLNDVCAHFPELPEMLALREQCEAIWRGHNENARNAVESRHYTEMMLKLGAWLSAESWIAQPGPAASGAGTGTASRAPPVKEFAETLLAHRHRQIKKYGRKLANLGAPELHAIRILVKKQRYAAEFFGGLYSHKKTKRYIKSLAALQDILGKMNDTAVIERLLSELPVSQDKNGMHEAIGIVRGWAANLALMKKPELNKTWVCFKRNDSFW
ncbi:CYTH and CHAD domain-containing protein [Nitrosovibrio sp. Nv6]|uniref:CYTH and CHAD domain-containing protein n=1 Tax=Nitrosovibrio sp. Nv6 TaxID=1855340 RepID=UPI0008ABCA84|nr:CYTH and CHAD domain-containing protein [Nitrosovibrio sp. Nv6]SEP07076.1 Inorganic triphosphatase YgiF, contains CYTH and CHAD domains [Nitrosovibrio sp. Nv6]